MSPRCGGIVCIYWRDCCLCQRPEAIVAPYQFTTIAFSALLMLGGIVTDHIEDFGNRPEIDAPLRC